MKWIKRVGKYILNSLVGCKCPNNKTIKKLRGYISFDIFDTLIVRDVSEPKEVFRKIEQLRQLPGFCDKRIAAEQKAREKAKGEVTIEDIYRCYPDIRPKQITEYCRAELDMELQVCHPNPRLAAFYQTCVEKGKVILVSDMYFATDQLKEILDSCGINGYERLFVSCEINETKRSGKLYEAVLKEIGVPKEELIHVGNDFMSDFIGAKRAGIKAVKVRTVVE